MTDPVTDLFDLEPGTARCPHLAYAHLRREAAPRWVDRIQAYVVGRYDDVVEILRTPERFSSVLASGPGSVTPLARRLLADEGTDPSLRAKAERRLEISRSVVLLNADPPLHRRQRKLVNKAFTARRVAAMEPSVEKIAASLLDAFVDDGRAEMVSAFSVPLPMTVIADILGVPSESHPTFKRWSDAFVAGAGSMNLTEREVEDVLGAVDEFYDYFSEQIDRRQAEPSDDLLSAVVHARIDDETPLSRNEMLQMLVQFLVAGNETTTSLLTAVMFALVSDASLTASVRADLTLLPKVIEEVLRLEAPVQGLFRTATEDVEIGGTSIPAGANLYLGYASANRDGRTFQDADRLLPERSAEAGHLAFGRGEHFCLGAPIARLEARVGIETWLARTTDIRLDADPDDVEYQPSFALHGIRALPLRFTPTGEPG